MGENRAASACQTGATSHVSIECSCHAFICVHRECVIPSVVYAESVPAIAAHPRVDEDHFGWRLVAR